MREVRKTDRKDRAIRSLQLPLPPMPALTRAAIRSLCNVTSFSPTWLACPQKLPPQEGTLKEHVLNRFRIAYTFDMDRQAKEEASVVPGCCRAFVIALIVAFGAIGAQPAGAQSFLNALDDVPAMPGLGEMQEPTVFESAFGRLIRVSAESQASPGAIFAFYSAALPSMGWSAASAAPELVVFERGFERLALRITPSTGLSAPRTRVDFSLVVTRAPSDLPEQ